MPQKNACIQCREKKRRCGGQVPICDSCHHLSLDCHYPNTRRKPGPKEPHLGPLLRRMTEIEESIKIDTTYRSSSSMEPNDEISPDSRAMSPPNQETAETELPQNSLGELYRIFFRDIHPTLPILHPSKHSHRQHLQKVDNGIRCLQYAMWSHAASSCESFSYLSDQFYEKARTYACTNELNDIVGVSLIQCQALVLISYYEYRNAIFPRAWLTAGKAMRLAHVLKLHRMDSVTLWDSIPGASGEWVEMEERRRAFWSAFCLDSYSGFGAGFLSMIDESDISTCLPSEDGPFENEIIPENVSPTLVTALQLGISQALSPFGSVVVLSWLAARTANHLRSLDDQKYWENHYAIEAQLLQISLCLPGHLKLPSGIHQPNAILTNMLLHALTVSLHQAAATKATENPVTMHLAAESNMRCFASALEIANIAKRVTQSNLAGTHIITPFCIFVALRYLMTQPQRDAAESKQTCQFLSDYMRSCAVKPNNGVARLFEHAMILRLEGNVADQLSGGYFPTTEPNRNSSGCLILTGGTCRTFQSSRDSGDWN